MKISSIPRFLLTLIGLWGAISGGPLSAQSKTSSFPKWALGGFVRPANTNPIISPDKSALFDDPMTSKPVAWESDNTFNPAATVKDGKIEVLYRAEDNSGDGIGNHTSRIGIAESDDGLTMKRFSAPVLFPADDAEKEFEWTGGCEDPRVAVTPDGTYVMLYTEWNHQVARLAVATSRDLTHWSKYGPVFRTADRGKFSDLFCKSASLVTEVIHGKQVIAKVGGKYWMYWGEDGVHAATSDDLIHWDPLLDDQGSIKALISPREGYFDSDLTECGPPAVITKRGIVLLYNGKNLDGSRGDQRFPGGAYCAGQVLFDSKEPTKVLGRLNVPFLRPREPFEKSGQYVDGTVFVEGMAYFHKEWFLYYGTADSHVAVAVYDPAHPAPPDSVPDLSTSFVKPD